MYVGRGDGRWPATTQSIFFLQTEAEKSQQMHSFYKASHGRGRRFF